MTTPAAAPDPQLTVLLERIWADGRVDADERAQLTALWREARLTLPVVRATFDAFLRATFEEAAADGVFTDEERAKLRAIVRELKLPPDMVPREVKAIL